MKVLTLTITKGLPASGKSTWAKEEVRKSKGNTKRVNKDDLRDMIDAGGWSKANEKQILQVRDNIIRHYLSSGLSVIVDDTNLHPKHERTLESIADEFGASFEVKSFLDVPLAECIKRDLGRDKSVGERIIRGMYRDFLVPEIEPYEPPANKPKAILCDIDGTLAHGIHVVRKPYEWDKVGLDTLDETVRDVLVKFSADHHIILMSGRDSICRQETIKWLIKHDVPYDELWMRRQDDSREDSLIKRELFDEFVKDNFSVRFVLDDRNRVVDMWRSMGLKVFQVAEGDF